MDEIKYASQIDEDIYHRYKRFRTKGAWAGIILMLALWFLAFNPKLQIEWLYDDLTLVVMAIILGLSILGLALFVRKKLVMIKAGPEFVKANLFIKPLLASFCIAMVISSALSCFLLIFKAMT